MDVVRDVFLRVGCFLLGPSLHLVITAGAAAGSATPTNGTLFSDVKNALDVMSVNTTALISPTSTTTQKALMTTTTPKLVKVFLPMLAKSSAIRKATLNKIGSPTTTLSSVILSTTNSTQDAAAAAAASGIDPAHSGLSPILFLFCLVLMMVAVMLVAKVVLNSKKSQFQGGNGFWTSRSSSQNSGGRLGLGGGPALGMPGGGISLGGGSAVYTAMPNSAVGDAPQPVAGSLRDPRLDWERQFFDNDDEEHLTTNMEVEPHTGSKLQLNLSR